MCCPAQGRQVGERWAGSQTRHRADTRHCASVQTHSPAHPAPVGPHADGGLRGTLVTGSHTTPWGCRGSHACGDEETSVLAPRFCSKSPENYPKNSLKKRKEPSETLSSPIVRDPGPQASRHGPPALQRARPASSWGMAPHPARLSGKAFPPARPGQRGFISLLRG